MDGSVPALRRALETGDGSPGGDDWSGRCTLCECSLVVPGDRVVDVTVPSDDEGPRARLCPSCYEYVVDELGVSPLQVFKSGRRRRVVFPEPPTDTG